MACGIIFKIEKENSITADENLKVLLTAIAASSKTSIGRQN